LGSGLFYLVNDVWIAPVPVRPMLILSQAGNVGGVWLELLGVTAVFGDRADCNAGRLFALVLAAARCFSRVYVGVNYLTDVVAGAGLGITSGRIGACCVESCEVAREV
jgi:hypothetical protein